VCEAIKKAGDDGVISYEEFEGTETSLEVKEGIRFDRGYITPEFITDPESGECVLENCLILVYESKISAFREILPLLEKVAKTKRPLMILAENVEDEALATLVVNKQRGALPCVAVRTPSSREHRKGFLEDIAILTGAKAITRISSVPLECVNIQDLGQAKKVIVDKNGTAIADGGGSPQEIYIRKKFLRSEIDRTTNVYESDILQSRLVNLVGGVTIIRIGGHSRSSIQEERYKIESGVRATIASKVNGWILGGGKALFNAKKYLEQLEPRNEAEELGIKIISQALEGPIRQIIANAKMDVAQTLLILEQAIPEISFNANNRALEDISASGIIDPTETTVKAIEVAFSRAKELLQTDDWDLSAMTNVSVERDNDT
jgi:chaperonin GroEL